MTDIEHVPPLPEKKRRLIFLCMVLAFVIAVPALVFYAIGYRFDFSDDVYNLKTVGGLYVTSTVEDTNIYVDDEIVDNLRVFRNAAYIQDLEAGVHEVYVERQGLHTWVKELPVFAYLVTEAQSFNMPVRPQIRLLTQWNTDAGLGVLYEPATSTKFTFASTTNTLVLATSTATSSLNPNLEYEYIVSRFASSSVEAAALAAYEKRRAQRFGFANDKVDLATTTATSTREYRDMVLHRLDEDVYATWTGDDEDIPYYFCMTNKGDFLTAQLYGAHTYRQLLAQVPTSTNLTRIVNFDERFCRHTIRIDRLQQAVRWFDFMPGSEHLVLMLLDDGLYVVEVDDRAWQNTQQLYPGSDLEVIIDGGRIFVKDGEYYLEALTEIAQ